MGFFNFKRKTIQIFFILLAIAFLFYVLFMSTLSYGPGKNRIFLNILAEIVLYPLSFPTSLIWPVFLKALNYTIAFIFAAVIEVLYLYLLACLINFLISVIKKRSKK